jgi:hypothetical protein
MKKAIITSVLAAAAVCAVYTAQGSKAKLVATPHVSSKAKLVAVPPVAPVKGAVKGGSTADLNLEMAKIQQKIMGLFAPSDALELMPEFQSALKAALGSKEFDDGVDKLRDAVRDMSQAFAAKVQVSKSLNTKITSALKIANTDFDKLLRSKKYPHMPGEVYVAQIVNSILQGLQKGFAKAKIAPVVNVKSTAVVKSTKVSASQAAAAQSAASA